MDKEFRRQLAAEAHHLKPLMTIGKEGVNDAVIMSIYEAFNTRELLKVKALDTCPDDRAALSEKLDALPEITLVRNIGKTFILYKKLEQPAEKPKPKPQAKPAAKSAARGGARGGGARSAAGSRSGGSAGGAKGSAKSAEKWPTKSGGRTSYGFRAESGSRPQSSPQGRGPAKGRGPGGRRSS